MFWLNCICTSNLYLERRVEVRECYIRSLDEGEGTKVHWYVFYFTLACYLN